eukprot:Clim_evm46s225 gene=Clim_evmTU46s225
MGAFRSKPARDLVEIDKGVITNYQYGAAGMQGWRKGMEDAHCVKTLCGGKDALLAVFDGHGGKEVAQYCAKHMADIIDEELGKEDATIDAAMKRAFLKLDVLLDAPEGKKELDQLKDFKFPGEDEDEDDEKDSEGGGSGSGRAFRIRFGSNDQDDSSSPEDNRRRMMQRTQSLLREIEAQTGLKIAFDEDELGVHGGTNEPNHSGEEMNTDSPDGQGDERAVNAEGEVTASSEVQNVAEKENEGKGGADQGSADQENAEQENAEQENAEQENAEQENAEQENAEQENAEQENAEQENAEQENAEQENAEQENAEQENAEQENAEQENAEQENADQGNLEKGSADQESAEKEGPNVSAEDAELEAKGDPDHETSSSEEEEDIHLFPVGSEDETGPGYESGTTAVAAIIREGVIYVANAGDSRAVLCRGGTAIDLSFDHKPESEEETRRIERAGGKVSLDGRVNNNLNLSRAIGDMMYKKNAELPPEEQMITALPDVEIKTLTDEDEFLIIACDGIWNSLTSQETVDYVSEKLKELAKERKVGNQDLVDVCEQLFLKCMAPNTHGDGSGCDNMTAVIALMKGMGPEGALAIDDDAESKRRKIDGE